MCLTYYTESTSWIGMLTHCLAWLSSDGMLTIPTEVTGSVSFLHPMALHSADMAGYEGVYPLPVITTFFEVLKTNCCINGM